MRSVLCCAMLLVAGQVHGAPGSTVRPCRYGEPADVSVVHSGDAERLAAQRTYEGVAGWGVGRVAVELSGLSSFLLASKMFAPKCLPLAPGTSVRIACNGCSACHVAFVLHHCPPCTSQANGGMPMLLAADGWTPSSCGPSFSSKYGGTFGTSSFTRFLQPGETYETPLTTTEISNFAVFVREGATVCDKLAGSACAANNECRQTRYGCESNYCPPKPKGPGLTCATCAPVGRLATCKRGP